MLFLFALISTIIGMMFGFKAGAAATEFPAMIAGIAEYRQLRRKRDRN